MLESLCRIIFLQVDIVIVLLRKRYSRAPLKPLGPGRCVAAHNSEPEKHGQREDEEPLATSVLASSVESSDCFSSLAM